jgi:hypothetical protein
MPVPIHENSTIVFELIIIDVVAGLHTVHLIPPGTLLIVLGTPVDRDKDYSFRRPNHLIGDEPSWRATSSTNSCRLERCGQYLARLLELFLLISCPVSDKVFRGFFWHEIST